MNDTLRAFMVKLASDPEWLTKYMINPQQTMKEAALSQEEQEVLLSGDQNRIYAAISLIQVQSTPAAQPLPSVVNGVQAQTPTQPQMMVTVSGYGYASNPVMTPWGQAMVYVILQSVVPGNSMPAGQMMVTMPTKQSSTPALPPTQPIPTPAKESKEKGRRTRSKK